MQIHTRLGLSVLIAGLGVCPSLFAVNYTWDFTGSAGSNCTGSPVACSTSAGNVMTFNASPSGGPTIKATAWYLNGTTSGATFQKATLGQYSNGLGICYPGENCTNPDHQVDNNAFDEYVLFEFSTPVDPSTVHITSTSSGDLDVSYWLGGTAGQNMNLTGLTTAGLSGLGFGAINGSDGTPVGTRDVDLTAGIPAGTVNAILFGAKNGDNDDYFKIGSMGGATGSGSTSAVPEPSSVILLLTVAVLGFKLSRRSKLSQGIAR
jgi:hypothetical protein